MPDGLALRPEFLDLLRQHRVIKPRNAFEGWLEATKHVSFSSRTTKALCEGTPSPSDLVRFLVEFCLDSRWPYHRTHNRPALEEFCAGLGLKLADLSVDQLVRLVSTPSRREPAGYSQQFEQFFGRLATLLANLGRDGIPKLVGPAEPRLSRKPTKDWISTLAEWIYVEHGRQHSPKKRLSWDDARRLATTKIGTELADYTRQAREWASYEPWTVCLTRVDGDVIGGTITLPVTEGCYRKVLSGKINTWQIKSSDLRSPSLFVVVEAILIKPANGVHRTRTITPAVHAALWAQLAYLTAIKDAGDTLPIRIVSADFSWHAQNELDRVEFQSAESTLPATDQRVRLLNIDMTELNKHNYLLFGFWRMLQHSLGGPRPVRRQPKRGRS